MATLLQTHRVSPPPPHGGELTLPLTFFDMWWVHFHPIRRVLFYDHPCSTSDFLNAVVPNLKQSLSLTLKHFLPAAGNLLYPNDTHKNKPLLRYAAGDAVQLTIAESDRDFDELTSSRARDADQFYDFVPELPPVREGGGDYKLVPLMAVQATLFPGRGVALGIVNLHCLGDGSSVNASLIFGWASINKFGGDEEFLRERGESLPIFDRSVIKDAVGIDTIFWNEMRQTPLTPSPFPLPTNRVRATFALTRSDIEKLKNRVLANKPGLNRVSSFVATACYVWNCMAKSDADGDGDAYELLVVPVDVRGRRNALIEPPVPTNYFGNCIAFAVTTMRHGELAGEGGFEAAAEAVAEEIKSGVNDAAALLKGAEDWMAEMKKCQAREMRVFGVSGSPKFDLAVADFGWGKARKVEYVTLDGEKYSMSLANAREGGGGLEFGLSLPKKRMEAFAAIFWDGLIN
ncbi:malonyl-coenzyme:anthocyanin 5-O-glucoside-6'''-O-malonyltransferase-like [Salvia miltiorrhiza]|uniref:malonyl-coenzyme:anthocyanin 5-O-glucoside-6'''-O-malonyltransferase-like n=1 Tax=Salvia miltiorrhiza TaxID=226208 RepID=UPI0025AC3F8B|nr:malonyl-coenzyme:anthocyanin 5-O-glucoside-6'''-O-malonyltransferase-like [Salvia miltiorrhiza]